MFNESGYSVAVIAIDGSGIPTVSTLVKFNVDKPPEVVITSPSDSARFSASSSLSIAATAKQSDGLIRRVDFYAKHLTDSRTMVNRFMNSQEYRLRFGP